MLLTTGRKESLSASKGSEIEVSSNVYDYGTGSVWYSAVLEENFAKSKRKKLSVRHLKPLLKEDYLPPLITTTFHRFIRPVPPQDPFLDVDFEEGDIVDAAHKGGWWSGWVIKVLGNQRFLVYLSLKPDVIELDRKDLRPHLVWKDEEWFRCDKRQLIESDFSAGKTVEFLTEVSPLGNIWAPAIAIKDNEDGTLMVKYKSLRGEEDECAKISLPYSKTRPSPPPFGLRDIRLMENVDAFLEFGWCPGVVCKLLSGARYTVILGQKKQSMDFNHLQLRPSMTWKDGAWQTDEKVSAEETTDSTRIPVTVQPALRDIRASGTGKKLRATRSSSGAMQKPLLASSNGGHIAETGKAFVIEIKTPFSETSALSGYLGSYMANAMMNGNTPLASQPEIPAIKECHSSIVLGVAATLPEVKTQGKTSPRKKLQAMNNQKSSTNDSIGEKAPEEMNNRESVNKRKRGQPRKFISSEPKQNTDMAAAIKITNMTDEDRPLASWFHGGNSSSGKSPSDPMHNSVVEKHIDVMETPPAKESTMVLPFAKNSPCWKVFESMEIFKTVPQRPHFSPLLEREEEYREGDAIGAMVMFTGLLDKVKNLQVDAPVSKLKRINECFVKLEKHGFNITEPQSRISKLLTIKERQKLALEELQGVERMIREKEKKRRKCEEDCEDVLKKIGELQKQVAILKEEKVKMEKEIGEMQIETEVLDQKVQNVELEFQTTLSAPWN